MVKLKGNKNTLSPSLCKKYPICESTCETVTNSTSVMEKHLDYIRQCADVNAARITAVTHCNGEFEEYRSMLIYQLVKASQRFNAERSKYQTFASMVMSRAAGRIIHRHFKQYTAVLPTTEQYN